MSRPSARLRVLLPAVAALAVLAAGCSKGDQDEPPPAAAMDTTNDNPLDGLSGAQVQEKASVMTPEEAERRGLVDTTIHMENLGDSDSVDAATAAGRPVPQPDTAPRGDARRDTLRAGSTRPGPAPAAGQGGTRP